MPHLRDGRAASMCREHRRKAASEATISLRRKSDCPRPSLLLEALLLWTVMTAVTVTFQQSIWRFLSVAKYPGPAAGQRHQPPERYRCSAFEHLSCGLSKSFAERERVLRKVKIPQSKRMKTLGGRGAGDVARLVGCLPSVHEALSL